MSPFRTLRPTAASLSLRLAAASLALAASLGAPARLDAQTGDRGLLATGGGDPYVMILFDTSGSMNWGTECTADDRESGYCEGGLRDGEDCVYGDPSDLCLGAGGACIQLCSHDCPAPNCPRPMNGDDPDSKIHQAKRVLYDVMRGIEGVRWGFSTLNQDKLAVGVKHFLYEVKSITETTGGGAIQIPAVGWQEVFGPQTGGSGNTAFNMTCDRNGGGNANNAELYETGCYMTSQDAPSVATTDFWSLEKIRRLPKGGQFAVTPVSYFMRSGSGGSDPYYRVTYGTVAGGIDYAATPEFTINVAIDSCPSNQVNAAATGCNAAWTSVATRAVTYTRLYDHDGDPGTAEQADPRLGEFLWWEGTVSNTDSGQTQYSKDAYFGGRTDGEPELPGVGTYAQGSYADKTCRGWEPPGDFWGQRDEVGVPEEIDEHIDGATSYSLRWPTTHNIFPTLDASFAGNEFLLDFGDIIPLNWDTSDPDNDNKEAVLKRLNPSHPLYTTYVAGQPEPDSNMPLFAQSPYFVDSYGGSENFLRLEDEDDTLTATIDEATRPLVANGSTPLAAWFSMFRHWYSGCGDPGECGEEFVGWSDIAAYYSEDFACSAKYVLIITDGSETCDGSPQENAEDYYEPFINEFPEGFKKTADSCSYRASFRNKENVESAVIGFGTENMSKLQCSGFPVYLANNAGELRELLADLLGAIKEQSAAFASAAVPTVQANILDKVYLSSFIPLNDESVWPGRLDSFLKPLPLKGNFPDRSDDVLCVDPTRLANCYAWDAGDSQLGWSDGVTVDPGYEPQRLLLQAPLASEVSDFASGTFDDDSLQLGYAEDERRVYLALDHEAQEVNRRMLFDFPADPADFPTDDTSTENNEREELTNYEEAFELGKCSAGLPATTSCGTDPDCDSSPAADDGVCAPDPALSVLQRRQQVADIVAFTLQEKQALLDFVCTAGDPAEVGTTCENDNDCGESEPGENDGVCTAEVRIQYLMGDVFHSNPLVLNAPDDFEYFTKNLYWPGDGVLSDDPGTGLCGDSAQDTALRGSQISYAWYSNKNLCRRVQLFVGTNDGQLHAFDAGIFRGDSCQLEFAQTAGDSALGSQPVCVAPADNEGDSCVVDDDCDLDPGNPNDTSGRCSVSTVGLYDFGSGRELFSIVPNSIAPFVKQVETLDDASTKLTTEWGVDGTPVAADVFVDPYVAPGDDAVCEERVWRTIVFTNYRTGGPGLLAIDVTQPDEMDEDMNAPLPVADSIDYMASCADGGTECRLFCATGDSDCENLKYPAVRWEFLDLDASGEPADDDANGEPDLAESWSRPFIARLPFCKDLDCDDDDEPEDRFVAIFGGGAAENPTNDANDVTGNWLYMVDVETGDLLYKRGGESTDDPGTPDVEGTTSPIVGSVTADITGIDEDTDGYVDTLYFGTTAGFVYKVNLALGGTEKGFLLDADGRIDDGLNALDEPDTGRFDPFQVFSTDGKPIYLEIGAVFVPKLRANALLFGTGDRSYLWSFTSTPGRFYAIVDDGWKDADRNGVVDAGLLTEADYPAVDPDSGIVADYLYGISGYEKGWYFPLGDDEKLITEPFTLTGVSFFTIYDPILVEQNNQPCARSGESKIFVVNTVTTSGYAISTSSSERTRYITAPTFTTQPFVEYSATKNPGADNSTTNADTWTDELRQIYRELKRLFPSGAKFANYTLDIKTVRSDTGLIFIAPVPVAIEPHNWKEF